MMRPSRPWRADNWADFLPSALGYSRPPVDLFAVARHRRIQHLGLRSMIPRGLLLPIAGGFETYLRSSVRRDLDISDVEPLGLLSHRQRFSLAHEIAHTFFYRLSDAVPSPDGTFSNALELEKMCDRTAGHILMPTSLLRREIGDYERIDATVVRSIASKFRTSLTVAIERISTVEPTNLSERCVLLARRLQGDAEILALYFGVGLLRTLPRPSKYTRVSEWIPDFPRLVCDRRDDCDWKITRMGRSVSFAKIELRTADEFLIEARVTASPMPSSSYARVAQG
jgi:hypothetical protein